MKNILVLATLMLISSVAFSQVSVDTKVLSNDTIYVKTNALPVNEVSLLKNGKEVQVIKVWSIYSFPNSKTFSINSVAQFNIFELKNGEIITISIQKPRIMTKLASQLDSIHKIALNKGRR